MGTLNLDFSELLSKMGGTGGTGGTPPKTHLETNGFNSSWCPTSRVKPSGTGGTNQIGLNQSVEAVPPVPLGHVSQVEQKTRRQDSENKDNAEAVPPVPPVPPKNKEVIAVTAVQLPADSCSCSCGHFMSESNIVDSPNPLPVKKITQTDLKALYPATFRRMPLSVILDHADPCDYSDLAEPNLLEAFSASLTAPGNPLWRYKPNPQPVLQRKTASMVRCCDCQYYIPSKTDFQHGIGGCKVDSLAKLKPAPWPKTKRHCDDFKAR